MSRVDRDLGARVLRAEDAATRILPAVLRITAALLWLANVGWKEPPHFGKSADGCRGLCGFVDLGVEHGLLPPWSWLLEHVVLPRLAVFGWLTLTVEFTLAALLLSGTFTRGAALLGLAQSLAIGLTVANAPGEWYWSYALMATLHLAVFATAAGRVLGVDAVLRDRPQRPVWLEALT